MRNRGGHVLERVEGDDRRERLVGERERGAVGEQEPAEVRARDVADEQLVLGQERLERPGTAADLEHERAGRDLEALEQLGRDLVPLVLVERQLEARIDLAAWPPSSASLIDAPSFTAPSQSPPSAITPCSSTGSPRSTSKRIVR